MLCYKYASHHKWATYTFISVSDLCDKMNVRVCEQIQYLGHFQHCIIFTIIKYLINNIIINKWKQSKNIGHVAEL